MRRFRSGISVGCVKADPAYGKGVADALGISLDEVPGSAL